ncbi:MAG TPA: alpha/beta hydrolase family protein [Bryobacteraceae bacterium]|nr:alpha/beta hydrolase family protein [Bryobacteraceae bacterium]
MRPEFKNLRKWQHTAREKVLALLHYQPERVSPEVEVVSRRDRDGFVEEHLTFRATSHSRVPAHVFIPSGIKPPFPGVVVLHDHGGFYMWGGEKVVRTDNEHPALTAFKQRAYSGRSIANELVLQGYAVIAIDMFYWGERRFLLPEDPVSLRERAPELTAQQVSQFNTRSSQTEQLVARSLFTAGSTWPGVMLWDDIRTLNYLASRPEADRNRLACVGLSVGGYRSFLLGALDPRIKAAVDVGWITTFAHQIQNHVIHTMGLTFVIPGMYRYFDLPDLSALIAPRALMVRMGSRDALFPRTAMDAAFSKIEKCYEKAGSVDRQ